LDNPRPRDCRSKSDYLRAVIDQIAADLPEKFLNVLDWSERTERWSDIIIDGACKDSDRRLNELIFLEGQIKILVQAIRVTKDVVSIRTLRATTWETIERMEERKREEDQKRLREEGAALVLPGTSSSYIAGGIISRGRGQIRKGQQQCCPMSCYFFDFFAARPATART
jgi:hypothetical protein